MTDSPTPNWTMTARAYEALVAALVERATGRPRHETLAALAALPSTDGVELIPWARDAAGRLIPDADVLPDNLPDLIRTITRGYNADTWRGVDTRGDDETAAHAALMALAEIFDVDLAPELDQ